MARKRNHKELGVKQNSSSNQPHQCFSCGKHGNWARNCPEKPPTECTKSGPLVNTHTPLQRDINPRRQPDRKCYNCHKQGYLTNRYPSRALYCGTRKGVWWIVVSWGWDQVGWAGGSRGVWWHRQGMIW